MESKRTSLQFKILQDDSESNFSSKNRYSYGQPVKGTWRATVEVTSNKGRYYRWRMQPPVAPIKLERKGSLNDDTGCYSLKLSGDDLGITKFDGTIDKNIEVFIYKTK